MSEMGVPSGKYKYSLDNKNRINFKKILMNFDLKSDDPEIIKNEGFHTFKDFVKAPGTTEVFPVFYIFNSERWEEFFEQVEEVIRDRFEAEEEAARLAGETNFHTVDDEISKFATKYCHSANLDSELRITFPKELVSYIQAKKNLFIQGFGNKYQVWSQENFDRYTEILSQEKPGSDYHGLLSKRKK